MKYVNAKAVLPHGLVEELQEYVQTGYIYIPTRESQCKAWGGRSDCRRELAEQNAGIVNACRQGVSLEELGDKYCLSVRAIRKIIYRKQMKGSRSMRLPVFVDLGS